MAADPLPASRPPGNRTVDEPTLLDLAIDDSWGVGAEAGPPITPHDIAVDGVHARPKWWPFHWLRRQPAGLRRDEIDELADESTEPIDRTVDPFWKTAAKTIGAFGGSAALAYLILTFPSQWVTVSYAIEHFGKPEAPATIVEANVTSGNFEDVVIPSLSFRPPIPNAPPQPPTAEQPFGSLGDNQLTIPKINVFAPVIWDSSFEEQIMLENLQKGVAHYGGTDLPNPLTGNVFITGHSSYYWWDSGQYKTVFALLDQLKSGDQVALTYQQQVYVYQVYESLVVKPSQVDVLDTTERPILSLMTCTPVGTSLNRLIVRANLVGVFDQGETGSGSAAAARPNDGAAASTTSRPASSATPPASEVPAPIGPGQTLDELPGLDSWLGR